ncbi:MAG TPA: caspase family protein, partial [Armatimonadota bacterium]|nr:caspase family protein [Armatimonadota bacterium]
MKLQLFRLRAAGAAVLALGVVFTAAPARAQAGNPPPACRILAPAEGDAISGDSARVIVQVSDDGEIPDVQVATGDLTAAAKPIFIGAKPIMVGAKPITLGAKELPAGHAAGRVVTLDVPLPAGSKELLLRATVTDADGQSVSDTVRLTRGPVKRGKLHLLAIGIGQYRLPQYVLPFAATDAQALAQAFAAQQGKQYASVSATVLTDQRATPAAIRAALAALREARTGDMVLLFLSGHAFRYSDPAGGPDELYLMLPQVQLNNPRATCFPWAELVRSVTGMSAVCLLLTDLNHAGNALGDRMASSRSLAESLRGTGIVMLASSNGSELAQDRPDLRHGIFTVALLEALSGKATAA